ncbi:MAG: alpha-hydroxy-acid oxidizing protein, partial [Candidatus Aquilonibacter sp.]
VRTGMDVLRALALGAKSCLLGRAYIYGLGAAGEAGVTRAIEIIRGELDIAMGLTATPSVRHVDPSVIA